MNKKFLTKAFAIVISISFVLSNSAMLIPQKVEAVITNGETNGEWRDSSKCIAIDCGISDGTKEQTWYEEICDYICPTFQFEASREIFPEDKSNYTSTDSSKDCKKKVSGEWRYADKITENFGPINVVYGEKSKDPNHCHRPTAKSLNVPNWARSTYYGQFDELEDFIETNCRMEATEETRKVDCYDAEIIPCDSSTATIIAHKIVCEDEMYLPNWGTVKTDGNPITSTTAQTFLDNVNSLAGREVCWLESGWDFQWGFQDKSGVDGVDKLPGDHIGPADGTISSCSANCGSNTNTGTDYNDWKNFDSSTGNNSPAQVVINDLEDAPGIWIRENLKEGYIPFTYPPYNGTENDFSAEIYCYQDVYKYDNYDLVESPELGETYYCVAFNAPKKSEVTVCKYDDQQNNLEGWQVALVSEESIDGPHSINVSDGTGTDSTSLPVGYYLIKVSGTYRYGSSAMIADAGYSYRPLSIPSGCDCWLSGFDLSSGSNGLMAWINGGPVYWGPFTNSHAYTTIYHHQTEGPVNISIYDDVYGDNLNNGDFKFEIFPIEFRGTTGENGCVTFPNVPYGSYLLDEENRFDWTNLSGLGQVDVDEPEETFDIVNQYVENGEEPYCGDGTKNGDEECDGTDGVLYGQVCTDNCTLDCDPNVNLILNGGFESPIVNNEAKWDIFANGAPGLEWIVQWISPFTGAPSPANLELHKGVNGWFPSEDSQYAELDTDWDGPGGGINGEEASVSISQILNTIPGRTYSVSFAFSPRPGKNTSENILKVQWDGNEIDTIEADGSSETNTNWSNHYYEVLASGYLSQLHFEDHGTPNSEGTFLDNVQVYCEIDSDPIKYSCNQDWQCVEDPEGQYDLAGCQAICFESADPFCGDGNIDENLGEECDGETGVTEGENFCTNTCKLIPVYNGDHICPEGTQMSETPIMSISVSSQDSDGEEVNLGAGTYLFKASGQYQFGSGDNRKADAGYGTEDNWASLRQNLGILEGAEYRGVLSLLSDMGTGIMGIVNWGEWNETHEYQKAYTFDETKDVTFVISDWYDEWYSSYQNQGAMSDNTGNLNLKVYRCVPPTTGSIEICKYKDYDPYGQKGEEDTILVGWTGRITGPNGYNEDWETTQTGCITISDLEFGSYTVTEYPQIYWDQMYPTNGGNEGYSILLDADNLFESVYFLNHNEVPTTYSCNTSNYQCSLDSNGPFGSLQGCEDACGTSAGAGGQYVPTGVVLGEAVTKGEEGIVAGASCVPYLYEYIKYGADNNPFEVKKLQVFLNGYLGLNLAVSGVYDLDTYNAVKRFQYMLKYDVLSPWVNNGCLSSEELATGYVYRTTKWAINNIFCPTPRPDVSDEKCYGGTISGLSSESQVLGESIALGEEGVLPEEMTLDTTETTDTTIAGEETEEESLGEGLGETEETANGENPAQGIIISLLVLLGLGGLAYFVFRGNKAV